MGKKTKPIAEIEVPLEVRDCGEAFVEGFVRECVAESMRNVAEDCAAEMTEELIRGTAKMFGVPFGLVLDGARAADAWVESMEKVEEAGRKRLLEERDRFLAELEGTAGKLIPAEPKKGVE